MSPQTTTLDDYQDDPADPLTDAERRAYEAVENGGYGVREFARWTNRAPGTVGNLLRRARAKIGGSDA
jgi:DNA-directed RNA polymerase specialized sigma24 family protein